MTQNYLFTIGAIAQLLGFISYVEETLKGKTKPNKVTWLIWAVTPLIQISAVLADDVKLAFVPIFMLVWLGPLLVFIVSIVNKNSYWSLGKLDIVCGVCSVVTLILWSLNTKEPIAAIIFSIASGVFAATPTIIKAWKYPETESVGPFAGRLFNSLVGFAAISIWNFSEVAFPAYLVIIDILLIISIYHIKIFKKEVFMFCPKCKSAFKEGLNECTDCNIPLVKELYKEDDENSTKLNDQVITKSTNSIWGKISFTFSITIILAAILLLLTTRVFYSTNGLYIAITTLLISICINALALGATALITGVIGLFKKKHKRTFAVLGIVLSFVSPFAYFLPLIMAGR